MMTAQKMSPLSRVSACQQALEAQAADHCKCREGMPDSLQDVMPQPYATTIGVTERIGLRSAITIIN